MTTIEPRSRRLKNHWEPHYNPVANDFKLGDWSKITKSWGYRELYDFRRSHKEVDLDEIDTLMVFSSIFLECDFEGYLNEYSKIAFIDCKFIQCDFAKSWLSGMKFTNCVFEKSSFTQSNLDGAEFRDCEWNEIGLSGNATILFEAYITNPSDFVDAMHYKIPKSPSIWKPSKNDYKYFATKATVARAVLFSMKKLGSEGEYYDAVEVHEIAQGQSRVAAANYLGKNIRSKFYYIQYKFLKMLSFMNKWGKNPLSPFLLLIGMALVFSAIYKTLGVNYTWYNSFEKSFNIAVITGYNLEASNTSEDYMRVVQAVHFALNLFLYTSFFATLVGRLSRVK